MRKQRLQTPINHAFFDQIDSPRKAYVLGFFVADGHIYENNSTHGSQYQLGFTSSDRAHLELVQIALESEHTIYRNGDSCFRVLIGSRGLVSALRRLGYTSHKSYEAHMPNIDSMLVSHFVRGLFDGDGCITRAFRAKDHVPYLVIDFNGTEQLLTALSKDLPATSRLKRIKPCLWRLTLTQRKAFTVLDWMYKESDGLRLERKHTRYLEAKRRDGFYDRSHS